MSEVRCKRGVLGDKGFELFLEGELDFEDFVIAQAFEGGATVGMMVVVVVTGVVSVVVTGVVAVVVGGVVAVGVGVARDFDHRFGPIMEANIKRRKLGFDPGEDEGLGGVAGRHQDIDAGFGAREVVGEVVVQVGRGGDERFVDGLGLEAGCGFGL